MVIAAGIVAVVSQLFQANDHTSVWLTFAIVWIACALGAIASSSLVFRVAEARKHITRQQHLRRTAAAHHHFVFLGVRRSPSAAFTDRLTSTHIRRSTRACYEPVPPDSSTLSS